ncbi:unnamed protein product, partial [Sphacelaria rigidula]
EINRRISAVWTCLRKYTSQLYGRPNVQLSLNVRLLKVEMVEALVYGCATWPPGSEDSIVCPLPITSLFY